MGKKASKCWWKPKPTDRPTYRIQVCQKKTTRRDYGTLPVLGRQGGDDSGHAMKNKSLMKTKSGRSDP